jgi:hypothetical protein
MSCIGTTESLKILHCSSGALQTLFQSPLCLKPGTSGADMNSPRHLRLASKNVQPTSRVSERCHDKGLCKVQATTTDLEKLLTLNGIQDFKTRSWTELH